jgi:hypothetical protein
MLDSIFDDTDTDETAVDAKSQPQLLTKQLPINHLKGRGRRKERSDGLNWTKH